MNVISIAIVDDHRMVAKSLHAWLESFDDLSVVGIASSGEELLARLDEWRPDVVIQDLLLPGGADGIEITRRILARRPATRVLALTASVDGPRRAAVLRAGAAGYLRKSAEPEILVAAIRAIAKGLRYVESSTESAEDDVDPDTPVRDALTDREVDVLRQLVRGRSNKAIAHALDIGEETVKTYVSRVFAKLDVHSRSQATTEALTLGLVSVEDLERSRRLALDGCGKGRTSSVHTFLHESAACGAVA